MNQKLSSPIDFDVFKITCHCCGAQKNHNAIKVMQHDVSTLHQFPTGTFIINCRYCADNPDCAEKAKDRAWIINKFFNEV